jgi:hypothetical protein
MKPILTALIFAWVFVAAGNYEAAIPYFTEMRDVTISVPDHQGYIVVDQALWSHARPDLGDIRLYDGQTQVPYVLKEQRGGTSSVEQPVKILNLGSVTGHTEFDLDLSGILEYNRIRLQLAAKNFVATAHVEGRNDLTERAGTKLGKNILYDFTRESLGASSVLKLPTSSFRYLHVSVNQGVRPADVQGALVSNVQEIKAAWTDAGNCSLNGQLQGRNTFFDCSSVAGVPVDRVLFDVPSSRVNFRRSVVVEVDGQVVARGEISRIRLTRGGQSVVTENLGVDLSGIRGKSIKVTVENGDDAPLPLEATKLLSVERRIYFDPAGKTALTLYSGDEKLAAPSYDYAEFFHQDSEAAEARLGPHQHNPAYTGRPDDRPWSERHPAVLWLAMLLAVLVLAALAIRGFTKGEKTA